MADDKRKQASAESEKKMKKLSVFDRIRLMNYKQAIRIFTLILGLVVIIMMTLFQLGFNKDVVWQDWLTNMLIMIGISLFGLYMGDTSWEDHLMAKEDGLYQMSIDRFEKQEKEVHLFLPQFAGYYTIHCAKELIDKKANYLANEGIPGDECRILAENLREYDIPEVFEHEVERKNEMGKTVRICRVEEKNRDAVEDMMKITLDAPKYAYFMTATAGDDMMGLAENGKIISKKRRSSKKFNFAMKIIVSIVFSVVFAFFTVKDFAMAEGGDAARQAWMNLVSRITHLCTSFAAGCSTAVIDIRLAADEIDNKTLMLLGYQVAIRDGAYKIETYEQRFEREKKEREEREERERLRLEEERKKAMESVVIPEAVDDGANSIGINPALIEEKK